MIKARRSNDGNG